MHTRFNGLLADVVEVSISLPSAVGGLEGDSDLSVVLSASMFAAVELLALEERGVCGFSIAATCIIVRASDSA